MLRAATDHYSHSDTGRQRRTNEDAYLARAPVFVVADGMGGAQAGEVASQLAVETFEHGLGAASSASAEELLAARAQEANTRIHEMSQEQPRHAGMGTTLTAAHVGEHDVAIAHVGDSRAYRLRGGQFERLTEDHSLVEEMRRRGQLTAEEADEHPQRSVITRALGPEPDVRVDTHSWRGEAGDIYLLCSDGLTSMVSEARVADIVRSSADLGAAGRTLIAAANDAGGRDNITVVLFALEEVDGADPAIEQPTTAGQTALKTADVRSAVARDVQAAPAPRAEPRRLQPRPPAGGAPARTERSRRGRRWATGFAVFALLVVPLALGGYIANQAVYFVGADDDGFVTVYRGLPYELPGGISMYKVNYVSGVPLRSLPDRRRKQLTDHTLRSHDDANDLVRELELGRLTS
ncbi:MAG: Stp1/IreP family PP2C-type Ser/Thr phosphatase [Actinomycetota bacterium]|nr:Stp1/IreP family PP2C-type Ser/Thr phosphatase [Actinomycetota bacterium]